MDSIDYVPAGPAPGTQFTNKQTFISDEVIDIAADRVMRTGTVAHRDPRLHLPTDADDKALKRVIGLSCEEFNAKLSERLSAVASRIVDRIQEKLEADTLKGSELFFGLAVTEDKRAKLDGRSSLAGATVNIQVNNFSPAEPDAREKVLQRIGVTAKPPVIGASSQPPTDV
jgi:hypothetical protein